MVQGRSLTCWWSRERELVDVRRPYLCWSSIGPDANDREGLEEPGQYTKEKSVRRLSRCRKDKHECSYNSGLLHRENFALALGRWQLLHKRDDLPRLSWTDCCL